MKVPGEQSSQTIKSKSFYNDCVKRFPDLKDSSGYIYYYNPCEAYNAGGEGCNVVYVSQVAICASYCPL